MGPKARYTRNLKSADVNRSPPDLVTSRLSFPAGHNKTFAACPPGKFGADKAGRSIPPNTMHRSAGFSAGVVIHHTHRADPRILYCLCFSVKFASVESIKRESQKGIHDEGHSPISR
jgi:hypothetical protein